MYVVFNYRFHSEKTFSFTLASKGFMGFTRPNTKDDNEGYAYVTITNSNLISGDKVTYSITKTDKVTEVMVHMSCINKPSNTTVDILRKMLSIFLKSKHSI